jgi:hypothetical protein
VNQILFSMGLNRGFCHHRFLGHRQDTGLVLVFRAIIAF